MADTKLKLEVIMAAVDRITRPLKAVMDGSKATSGEVKALRDKIKGLNDQASQIEGFRRLQSQTAVVGQNMAAAQDRVRQLAQQIQATENPTKAMTRAFEAARREASQLTTQHQEMTQRVQRQRDALNDAGLATTALASHQRRLKTEVQSTTAALADEQRKLEAINEQAQRLRAAQASYNKAQATASSLAGGGARAMAGGAAAGYGLSRFLGAGVDFEAQMSKVQALARLDKDGPQMQALREQAKALGASTSFSAGNVASGQAFLAMAGFTPDAVRAAMPGLLDMAKAGDIDLGRGADISSNILSGMGINPAQMGRVADVLTRTFTGSNTTLGMLGETMAYAAPVAKIYGQQLEVVSAMAGKLGDAGVQGSMAGTAIAAIMNRLAAPPKMAADAIEQLGLKTQDAAGNMRAMPDILKEIYDKTQGMGNAQRGALLKAIAGEEAVKGMATLVDQAGSGDLQKFVATLQAAQGSAAQTAGIMSSNLAGDIVNAKSAFESIQIALADANNGWLRDTAQWVTDMTRSIGQWATANPRLVQTVTMLAAGLAVVAAVGGSLALVIAALLGPLALAKLTLTTLGISGGLLAPILAKLVVGIKAMGAAFAFVFKLLLANPIVAVAAAIAAAAVYVWSNWDTLGPKFGALWEGIKTGAAAAWSWVTDKARMAGQVMVDLFLNWTLPGLIIKHWDSITAFIGGLPAKFATMGGQIIDGLMGGLSQRWEAAKAWFTDMGNKIAQTVRDALGIKSPSRVFAEIGGHVMGGLTMGLDGGEDGPLSRIKRLTDKVAAAGAGIALGMGAAGAAAAPFGIDTRPPLTASTAASAGGAGVSVVNQITIHAAPGMDEAALARLVAAEIDKATRRAQVAQRSRLTDGD